jgi:hypothetical protein
MQLNRPQTSFGSNFPKVYQSVGSSVGVPARPTRRMIQKLRSEKTPEAKLLLSALKKPGTIVKDDLGVSIEDPNKSIRTVILECRNGMQLTFQKLNFLRVASKSKLN